MQKEDQCIIVNILQTLIYNSVADLKEKLIKYKQILSNENYTIMMFGNFKYNNNYVIKELDNRWCLKTQLDYHLERTKKINKSEYNMLIAI